jgi:bifunctional non-homologous end joining protein LigD
MSPHLFFVAPMECKEVQRLEDVPRGNDWQYEIKFDGYRCLAIKQRNEVELFSRRGNAFSQFLNLYEPLREQPPRSFILDGEVVALDPQGHSDFNALQRVRTKPIEVHFFAFDLLHLNGKDLTTLPLIERQSLLARNFVPGGYLHIPGALNARLENILPKIQELRFEGIVAKRRDSPYVPGKASGHWVKKKIKQSADFIVGGFEPGKYGLDDLAIGRFAGRRFMFVALVDDGFVPATRRQVFKAIEPLRVSSCPFANLPEKKGMHKLDAERMEKMIWVKPKIVVEIAMNEWTPDRHLRHSEFKCLRDDIAAPSVPPYPET